MFTNHISKLANYYSLSYFAISITDRLQYMRHHSRLDYCNSLQYVRHHWCHSCPTTSAKVVVPFAKCLRCSLYL